MADRSETEASPWSAYHRDFHSLTCCEREHLFAEGSEGGIFATQWVRKNYSGRDRDQRLCPLQNLANFYGGNSAGLQKAEKFLRMLRRHCDQQASGGLRVE